MKKQSKLATIIEVEKILGEIQDVDVLLERILTETRNIVHADAGSIYVVEGDNLRIKYAQNDTHLKELQPGEKLPYTSFTFPMDETSISGYAAISGKAINIKDAYKISKSKPYQFNKITDRTTDYRTKSIYTIPLKMANGNLLGVLQIINAMDENGEFIPFSKSAMLLVNHFATSAVQALQHAFITNNMVKRMLKMAEFRDPKETYLHVERVSNFSLEIYDRWAFNHNVDEDESHSFRDILKIASKFHDVGKIGISDVILKKKQSFTDDERSIMKGHTCLGAKLFDPPQNLIDKMSIEVSLHHHDWFDGSEKGYPGEADFGKYEIGAPLPECERISGEEIPLAARIVAVADVFDALSHARCYKDSWNIEDCFNEIERGSGSQFDPEVVKAFIQMKKRIIDINNAFPDEE